MVGIGETGRDIYPTLGSFMQSNALPYIRMGVPTRHPGSATAQRTETLPASMSPSLRPVPTISLCMIVRDKPRFDEIIVVDTGSTDRTVAIAEECGAKVSYFPWIDDFSAARNESLAYATGDWVMWMDADDTLPEECGVKLQDLAMTACDATTGFLLEVHISPAPGEHGFTIVDHVKFFRNLPELRFGGRIHEQILESINPRRHHLPRGWRPACGRSRRRGLESPRLTCGSAGSRRSRRSCAGQGVDARWTERKQR